jgi:hypothetical protein
MSANAASLSATLRPIDTTSAFSWGRYARIGLLTIGTSVLANAVFFYLAQVADFAYIPTVDGVSNAEIAVLVVMHTIAAVVITRGLTSVRR